MQVTLPIDWAHAGHSGMMLIWGFINNHPLTWVQGFSLPCFPSIILFCHPNEMASIPARAGRLASVHLASRWLSPASRPLVHTLSTASGCLSADQSPCRETSESKVGLMLVKFCQCWTRSDGHLAIRQPDSDVSETTFPNSERDWMGQLTPASTVTLACFKNQQQTNIEHHFPSE